MDFDSLKNTVSNLTLYDLKAGVRKVQNAVMNYTEMEAKVREATNNEPWGASSSLMQEIANGTHNYQLLNEIMPMIYKRFTEKAAEEWRQIYKALQLLEFLIKNGSERVIDDARSHLSLLKMLRQFHFIDQNGKDQGINVRNRAKELAELLSDVEKIRAERKKSKSNRNKYTGVEGGNNLGGGFSSGESGSSRYGGFGSEDAGGYGAYSGGVYGDGGGFGGNTSGFSDTQARRDRFEEYDEYDEGSAPSSGRKRGNSGAATSSPTTRRETKKAEPPKPKQPEVDLFSFDDPPAAPAASSGGKQPATSGGLGGLADDDDDDFDDFQSAAPTSQTTTNTFSIAPPASTSTTTSATQFAAPQPRSGTQGASINDLFASISPPATVTPTSNASAFAPPPMTQSNPMQPSGYTAAQPNYYQSVPLAGQAQPAGATTANPAIKSPMGGAGSIGSKPAAPKAAGGDAFAGLLSGTAIKKSGTPSGKGPSMADMAKQKASAGIWGAPAAGGTGSQPTKSTGSSGLDDLLG